MDRKKEGANLDVLSYQYEGNQLTRVEDSGGPASGDDLNGFKDFNSVVDAVEYEYDVPYCCREQYGQ